MSRAFMKEPESGDPKCPGCGGPGSEVSRAVVEEHAPAEAAARLAKPTFWCPAPDCRVAYFDGWAAGIRANELTRAAWPKEPAAPLCACFGMSAEDVEEDGRARRPERLRELIARSQTAEARCDLLAPDGRCCVPHARRLYLRAAGLSTPEG